MSSEKTQAWIQQNTVTRDACIEQSAATFSAMDAMFLSVHLYASISPKKRTEVIETVHNARNKDKKSQVAASEFSAMVLCDWLNLGTRKINKKNNTVNVKPHPFSDNPDDPEATTKTDVGTAKRQLSKVLPIVAAGS
jgi:F420-dependent methylenetetrahydromethanopterin dehydrogenase